MVSVIEWQALRTTEGSQHKGFECLCCQLAESEEVPEDSVFNAKGDPDAGVECFWKLPGGDEWGWQAKFFTSPPGSPQWDQLDDSVKKAIEKHPRLVKYVLCFPIDRPDPRNRRRRSFRDNWDARVIKWQEWARANGMKVDFLYWGRHEIFERLAKEEHRGRYYFWFNKESFSSGWYARRLDEAIAHAGPRYTPELHVDLPQAEAFRGLERAPSFFDDIDNLRWNLRRTLNKRPSDQASKALGDTFDSFMTKSREVLATLDATRRSEVGAIDVDAWARSASEALACTRACIVGLRDAPTNMAELKGTNKQATTRESDSGPSIGHEILWDDIRRLEATESRLMEIEKYSSSKPARLANLPALLLVGKAGTGKTHMMCDTAAQRVEKGLPTVLLFGAHFRNQEPWSQMIQQLGLSCAREEFLGALEASAQATGSRALIMIDALNEGDGRMMWVNHLAGMLATLSHYPRIAIAASVRTSYEEIMIPEDLVPRDLVRMEHEGFAGVEHLAASKFFEFYGILPSFPVLIPEFQGPLFLKMFCKGLQDRGLDRPPSGLKGLTAVFSFYVDSINLKLARPECMDYDPLTRPVQNAIAKIAAVMAEKGQKWLPRESARELVDSPQKHAGFEKSLFAQMIWEGLLAEERFPIGVAQDWCDGIEFPYERFTDHLIAEHLLDMHLDRDNPAGSFVDSRPLGSLVSSERACWENSHLIEVLSIQLPERIERELVELAPSIREYVPVREAFVDSLIWRRRDAITEETWRYATDCVAKYANTQHQLLSTLLTIAQDPDHPYNADFLHGLLVNLEMADRDAWWSVFLHEDYQHELQSSVERLVEWAWSPANRDRVDDQVIRLTGIAMAWLLTSSNRFLRDRATKAMVSLFTDRIETLRLVLERFRGVNDPYVVERLFAIAYGCAMRSPDDSISSLATDVHDQAFQGGALPHILARDYARGVIELTLSRGIDLNIDVQKIRPPYNSEWPSFEIPDEQEIKEYGKRWEDMPDEEYARIALYSSLMEGDFARYEIGTNSGFFPWLSVRLGERREPLGREAHDAFVQSLTEKQEAAWTRYLETRQAAVLHPFFRLGGEDDSSERELTEKELSDLVGEAERALRKLLRGEKRRIFETYVIPHLEQPGADAEKYRFDLSMIQRWILKRAMDLGWTVKRFGRFDRAMQLSRGYGRAAGKPERIGKKYQWIAYHELLARVADNFAMAGGLFSDEVSSYSGPWQIDVRDIDPSCVLRSTPAEDFGPHPQTWWFPVAYDKWDVDTSDGEWLRRCDDLPPVESLIEVTNPEDGSPWLVLETYVKWEQPTPPWEDRYDLPRREIWYMLRSYIVKRKMAARLFAWAQEQRFWGRWMPESNPATQVFIGEYFWSPASRSHGPSRSSTGGWTRGSGDQIPAAVLVSGHQYRQEFGTHDCSIDETIQIYLPSEWLAEKLDLRWSGHEGHHYDPGGNLAAFDPSVENNGPGALLANRETLLRNLMESGYDIVWTLIGEKIIIRDDSPSEGQTTALEASGAFRIVRGRLRGGLRTMPVGPGHVPPSS